MSPLFLLFVNTVALVLAYLEIPIIPPTYIVYGALIVPLFTQFSIFALRMALPTIPPTPALPL